MKSTLKEDIERWAGDQFIKWYNAKNGTAFTYQRHGVPPAPDLEYTHGLSVLQLEVTGAFYDDNAARFEYMNARALYDAPTSWSSIKKDGTANPIDTALLASLNQRLADKGSKSYSATPILIVHHHSRLFDRDELRSILEKVAIPKEHPFAGIYFLADLPDGDLEGNLWVHPLTSIE